MTRSNLIVSNPSSIIAVIEQKQQDKQALLAEKANFSFASDKEMIYHLTHQVNNVKHNNGRIYMKIDKDGKLFANSVSPYSDKYMDNIEQKIKPLVNAFHKKRYLTYSSCEGHGLTFRRYIGLAFADQDSRIYVVEQINKLNLPGVYCKLIESVANQKIKYTNKGDTLFVDKYTDPNSEEIKDIRKNEVSTFNIQFHRQYDSYYFLEIIILPEVKLTTYNPLKICQLIWWAFLKKYYCEKITHKITLLIQSDKFKKYPY